MKLSFSLMCVAALLLAGCSRPVVKETVVEKPVLVSPAPATAGAGSTIASCTYASQAYSHGSVSCQDRAQYRCDNGVWNRTMNAC